MRLRQWIADECDDVGGGANCSNTGRDFIHSPDPSSGCESSSLCIDDARRDLCQRPTPGRSYMLGEPPHLAWIVASCRAYLPPSSFPLPRRLHLETLHSGGAFLPTPLGHVDRSRRSSTLGHPFVPTIFCHVDLIGRSCSRVRAPFSAAFSHPNLLI